MRISLHCRLLFLCILISLSQLSFAQDETPAQSLEIIELNHRSANEIIPVIKPLLDQNARVSGSRNQLILRASDANIEQVKKILAEIDKPLARLTISIKYARKSNTDLQGANVSGNVTFQKDKQTDSLQPDANFNARITSTRSDENNKSIQQMQVIDGNWANFNVGRLTPQTDTSVNISGNNTTVQSKTNYRHTGSGFRIKPTVRKDRVNLLIETHNSKTGNMDNRNIEKMTVQTEISGRLGSWIELGGTEISINNGPSGRHYSTKRSFTDDQRIWIRVDKLENQ